LAVLAIDGPGQSEAAVRGLFTSPESWVEAGTAILAWISGRPELDADRIVGTGISFGWYFMSLVAATHPEFKGCAVALQCFEPGGHAIFEQQAPSYKARHMWMAGLERDEDAFDRMVTGYDLRGPIAGMSAPWKVFGGEADELCDKAWVYEMADRSPAPASSLLYEGATHSLGGSPAARLWGYSVDRTFAGQTALQGRFARGRSGLGGWPGEEGGLGGTRFGCGSATRSR